MQNLRKQIGNYENCLDNVVGIKTIKIIITALDG